MADTEKRTEIPASAALSKWLASPSRFLILLAGYFVIQIILRLVTSGTLDLDEAEQLLATQRLQWGYGPQPPLYTWLLFPWMQLSGPSLLTLTVFKNALLFGIYALTYTSARLIFRSPVYSALAALSLMFLPQLSWEAQSDLTHSIMVTFMAAATFCVFLKLNNSRATRWYLLFGICLGLGVLSKYSFLVFASGLLIGAVFVRSTRPTILNPNLLLSLIVAAVLVTPHLVWAKHHAGWLASTVTKFKMETGQPWLLTSFIGLRNLLASIGSHLAPIVILYFLICGKRLTGSPPHNLPDTARVIQASLIAMFFMLACGPIFFEVTAFKERWFLPFCVWLPILLVAFFSSRLNAVRIRWLIGFAGIAALVISVLIPSRIWFVQVWEAPQTLNAPLPELAREINRQTSSRFVIANDNWVGGNLKLGFPQRVILSPNNFVDVAVHPGDRCVVVWDALRSVPMSQKLLTYANQFAEIDSNEVQYVEAPMKFRSRKIMRLGFTTAKMKPDPDAIAHSLPLHR